MQPVRVAQISDLHVRYGPGTGAETFDARLAACVEKVNTVRPDAVIATGDIVHRGRLEEYRRLRELLAPLTAPYFLLPGNHDSAQVLREAFPDHTYLFQSATPRISYSVDVGTLRVLGMDSAHHGRAGGILDSVQLEWLESQLRADGERPTLLAMHHPPFAARIVPLDWLGYVKVGELERIVGKHGNIKRVASGHVHCARAARWAGTIACTSPSTKFQHLLLWEPGRLPRVHREEPGFLLHELQTGGEIRTSVHRVNGDIEELHIP